MEIQPIDVFKEVYKVKNPFTSEDRLIFFLSDPPHLVKTTRNC